MEIGIWQKNIIMIILLFSTVLGVKLILLENKDEMPNNNILSVRRVRGCYRLYGFLCFSNAISVAYASFENFIYNLVAHIFLFYFHIIISAIRQIFVEICLFSIGFELTHLFFMNK